MAAAPEARVAAAPEARVVAAGADPHNWVPVSVRRIHFRPPGLKAGSRIGPLGPFRGTLGIHWVIGSIVVGLLILFAVTWGLFHAGRPTDPFRVVGTVDRLPAATAREVLGGVFLGRTASGQVFAVAEPANCPLEVDGAAYVDCLGLEYQLDGRPVKRGQPLIRLPLQVYRGEIFVDPTG
ncbi:MAG TPA: hypothetical protein VHL78_08260 [Actinomycetota bacterium]|nr:hypothetical protein [Actinomycetota bacterium]